MTKRIFGFSILGLSDSELRTSGNKVIYTTEKITFGSAISSQFTNTTIKAYIDPKKVSGFTWSSDPRQVIGSGGEVTVEIPDITGNLHKLLFRNARVRFWDIESARVEPTVTSLRVTSPPQDLPQINQVYWINEEAVKVTNRQQVGIGGGFSDTTFNLILTRAQCGSFARNHRLVPSLYYPGGNGVESRMKLDERPDFDIANFGVEIYLFEIDPATLEATSFIRRFGFVKDRPRPTKKNGFQIRVSDVGEFIRSHEVGGQDREVTLSHHLTATELIDEVTERFIQVEFADPPDPVISSDDLDFTDNIPRRGIAFLKRLEAERIFDEPVHVPGADFLSESLIDDLRLELFTSAQVDYYLEVEASGKYLFRINNARFERRRPLGSLQEESFFRIDFELAFRVPGSKLFQDQGKNGWTTQSAEPVLSGDGPKVALRTVIRGTPIEILLLSLISQGGKTTDVFDKIIGSVGMGFDASWINLGTTVADPLTVDIATNELLERNQILEDTYQVHISSKEETNLGDILAQDICLLHSLMLGPLQSGKITLRPWARPLPSGAIVAFHPNTNSEPDPSTTLPSVKQIQLSSGFDPDTLDPEFTRLVKFRRAKSGGRDGVQSIRIWRRGNHIADQDIESGSLSDLIRAFFQMYGGQPQVIERETNLDWLINNSIEFADFVQVTDKVFRDENGNQASNKNFLLIGYSINYYTGSVLVRLVEDNFNDSSVQVIDSNIAPALEPTKTNFDQGGSLVEYTTKSIGDSSFDATTAHGGVWSDINTIGAPIKITVPTKQNALSASDRVGYLEAYGTVDSIRFDPGLQESVIKVSIDSSWARDGIKLADFASIDAKISLVDQRQPNTHPQGAPLLAPRASQLHNDGAGNGFSKVSGNASFDKTLNKIG